jgi:hypothetical protein
MKKFGPLFQRISATTILVALALAVASPFNASVLAQAVPVFSSDDFNRCSLDTSVWSFENPLSLPDVSISGQYTAASNAVLALTVPSGQEITFSDKNTNAPRIMQAGTDGSFEVEVKFASPLGQPPAGAWNIQGLLFRDTTTATGKTRWLRFDLDSNNTDTHYYVAYIDENGALFDIKGPAVINSQFTTSPLYLRVKYEQPTGTWSVAYRFGDSGTIPYKFSFTENLPVNQYPGGINFVVSGVGIFAGSTGPTAAGHVAQVDYFRDLAETFTDDAINLNVQTVGSGTVERSCSGTTVSLNAVPNSGDTFTGWSGDASGSAASVDLVMSQSRSVTATFTGSSADLPLKFYMPSILR